MYWSFKEELSVQDGLLFKCVRLVVPRPLRAEVLDEIHGAHLGKTKAFALLETGLLANSNSSNQRQSQLLPYLMTFVNDNIESHCIHMSSQDYHGK